MRIWKTIVGLVIGIAISLGSGVTASAAGIAESSCPLAESGDAGMLSALEKLNAYPDLVGGDKENAISDAQEAFTKNAVLAENATINSPHLIKKIENTILVSAMINTGNNPDHLEGISFIRDLDEDTTLTFQISAQKVNSLEYRVKTYLDGKLDTDKTVTIPASNQFPTTLKPEEATTTSIDMNKFKKCLSDSGLGLNAGTIIAALGVAGSCAACPAIAPCVVCIGSLGIASGAVANCVAKSWVNDGKPGGGYVGKPIKPVPNRIELPLEDI